jgi:hypothetical protein
MTMIHFFPTFIIPFAVLALALWSAAHDAEIGDY